MAEKKSQFGLLRLVELSHDGIIKIEDGVHLNATQTLFCLGDENMHYFASLAPLPQSENIF
ncbi:MAG: hypothetical protein H0T62_08750 [Parachlamydiaceae bacterium]|nr:hypothetical protein [Parachlamydiaceae bacterium]